jgi:uncharacterized protein YndB with AHSA1/START domain
MKTEATRTVEVEQRVKARPETVFEYFTDPIKYCAWKGVEARFDPRPGGIYRVDMIGTNGVRGEFVEVDAPRRLVFTWGWEAEVPLPPGMREVPPGSTRVEVTFTPDGDETIVRLRHSGLPTIEASTVHTQGWDVYLPRLAMAAAGSDPGADPAPDLVSQLYGS